MTSLTQHSAAPVRMERLALPATDGYPLSAYRYHAPGHAHGNLLVAGATGVAQRFYRRFAEHAARQGFDVLTLDYRGIGESAPASLKGFAMSYLDWAYRDLAAAVELLGREERPLYWIGHSFGGHAIGLLPDHGRLAACYSFGSGAGWSGWMSRREALKVRLLWTLVLPPLVAWKGYMAWSLLGMGDDLPLGVYRDWKRWCRHPRYYFDDLAMRHLHQRYAAVRTPCLFATALDDPWAPPRSRDAFVEAYRNAPLETLDLRPDGGPLGHMGYFRAGAEALWDDALRWLRRHPENA
ncbi:alpha/beta fold hydrolase [Pseudomonas aeruginosa]